MYRVLYPSLIAALLTVGPVYAAAMQERPSPEAWSAQQRASGTPLSDDDAAIVAANSRALGEACGLSATELSRIMTAGGRADPAFEAAVQRQMAGAKRRIDAQKRAPEFQQNCEFMRFRLETGN